MNVAVIGTSRKENEKRVAIHPALIKSIPVNIRKQLYFESGYGQPFGVSDEKITTLTGNIPLERKMLFKSMSSFIIPKPVEKDFKEIQDGSTVWGWIHSVQSENVAQIAIDKKLTLIAWENMYNRTARGSMHLFQKNNEMAGYCGVQHALQLRGIDGIFGAPRKVSIFGFGSVSRGAVYALRGHGFNDITVYTKRSCNHVSDQLPGIKYKQIKKDKNSEFVTTDEQEKNVLLISQLIKSDIIVNGILQNPNSPLVFIHQYDICKFNKECLIIDISCDTGMGFSFAKPTTLANPFIQIENILYYSCDHTPTLLWDSASWEISKCLLPYLDDFVSQSGNPVIDKAIDIRDGIILNKSILEYQKRSPIFPYNIKTNQINSSEAAQQ